jgi:hypothetical protein
MMPCLLFCEICNHIPCVMVLVPVLWYSCNVWVYICVCVFQASWSSLRTEFMPLNPAQLHHMLREYNPGRACPADWNPSPDEAEAALRTSEWNTDTAESRRLATQTRSRVSTIFWNKHTCFLDKQIHIAYVVCTLVYTLSLCQDSIRSDCRPDRVTWNPNRLYACAIVYKYILSPYTKRDHNTPVKISKQTLNQWH